MGRYDSPLSVATLFVGATFVSVALIFLFDAEASSRLGRAKTPSVITTLQQQQQLQEQTTDPLQRVQRSTTLKDLNEDVSVVLSTTPHQDKTSSTGVVGGVFSFFSGKIKDLFKRHHRWRRAVADYDDQAGEEMDEQQESSSEEQDDDDDQETQEPLALYSMQKFQPDYARSSSSSSSNPGGAAGTSFSSESKTHQTQPGSSSSGGAQLSSSAANFHKIRHAMKKLGSGGLDFSAVERLMVDSNPPVRPRIPEASGGSEGPLPPPPENRRNKHTGGHGSQRAKPPPPPLPRFDDDKFDTMSIRRSHVTSIDSSLPTGIFTEHASNSRNHGRVSFAPLESPRDSDSSIKATTHSASSSFTVTETIERDRRASMASTTSAQVTPPPATAATVFSNPPKAYSTYFDRSPSVVANTSVSSAWRSSSAYFSPSSSAAESSESVAKHRFTLDPSDDTERSSEPHFPVVFPEQDHERRNPLEETSTTQQRHFEPQIPALQSGIYYHQSQDHIVDIHQPQSTSGHQTSHNHNSHHQHVPRGQPDGNQEGTHSHRSIKDTYDEDYYSSSAELPRQDPDDDQMPGPVSSSTVATSDEDGDDDDDDNDEVPESDLASSFSNTKNVRGGDSAATFGFVDPATKRAILRENLEICYKTDDVLIVVAITCCLNFAFVLVIWGCVRWFSISSSAKDREFHHLDCEDAGDSILFHEDEGTSEPQQHHQHDDNCCWKRRGCLDLDSDTGNVVNRRKCKNCGKDTLTARQKNIKQLGHDTVQTHPQEQQQLHQGTLSNDKRMVAAASDFAESGKISSFKQSSTLSLRHQQHEQQIEDPYNNSLASVDQQLFPKSHVPSLRRPSDKFHFVLQKHYQRNLKEFGLGFVPRYNSQEEEEEAGRGGYGEDVVVENNYHPTFDSNPFYNQSNYYPPSYNSHHHNHHHYSTTKQHSRETSNSPPRISSSLYSFRQQQQQQQQLLQKQQSSDKIIVPRRKTANPNTFSPYLSSASSSAASSVSSLNSRKSKEKSYSHSMEDLRCVHT